MSSSETTATSPGRPALQGWLAITLLIVAALLFSTGGLFVRSLDATDAWTAVFWRSLSSVVSLAIIVAVTMRTSPVTAVRRMGVPGLLVAFAFAIAAVGMVVALTQTTVAVVLVIFSLGPLFASVLARVFLHDPIRVYTWVALAVTVVGVVVMVSGDGAQATMAGVLVALAIPLSFAGGTVIIRKSRDVPMLPAMLVAGVMSVLVSLPFATPSSVSRHDLIILLAFGGLQLGVGLAIFSIAAPHRPPTEVAMLSLLEPIGGPVWVWFAHGEYPGVTGLIGGIVVFAAIAVHTLIASREASRATVDGSVPG